MPRRCPVWRVQSFRRDVQPLPGSLLPDRRVAALTCVPLNMHPYLELSMLLARRQYAYSSSIFRCQQVSANGDGHCRQRQWEHAFESACFEEARQQQALLSSAHAPVPRTSQLLQALLPEQKTRVESTSSWSFWHSIVQARRPNTILCPG
jgi:hypothetical protein